MKTELSSRKPACSDDVDVFTRYQTADCQSPEALLQTLRFLLMRYASHRSPLVAGNIANCLNTLLAHPNFKAAPSERCTYRQMRAYWRLVETLG